MPVNTHFWDELAIEAYKTVLKSKPECALAYHNLGIAYTRVNRLNKAVRAFQKALKCDPSHIESFYHLGRVYQQLGKEAEAVRCFNNYSKNKEEGSEEKRSIVSALLEELQAKKTPLLDCEKAVSKDL